MVRLQLSHRPPTLIPVSGFVAFRSATSDNFGFSDLSLLGYSALTSLTANSFLLFYFIHLLFKKFQITLFIFPNFFEILILHSSNMSEVNRNKMAIDFNFF